MQIARPRVLLSAQPTDVMATFQHCGDLCIAFHLRFEAFHKNFINLTSLAQFFHYVLAWGRSARSNFSLQSMARERPNSLTGRIGTNTLNDFLTFAIRSPNDFGAVGLVGVVTVSSQTEWHTTHQRLGTRSVRAPRRTHELAFVQRIRNDILLIISDRMRDFARLRAI
jgi:hypothetical protein